LGTNGALKGGEHSVGMLALHRDNEVGKDGGILLFRVCNDVRPVGGRFECCVGELKVVVIVVNVGKECSCGV